MGGVDRVVRAVVGVWLEVVAFGAFVAERRAAAVVDVPAGAGWLWNALTQFRGFNALLGVDTCPDRRAVGGADDRAPSTAYA